MTDKTTPQLGKLTKIHEKRDAIHIAVAPVIATEKLNPGQHIKFSNDTDNTYVCATYEDAIGIVDPFLKQVINKGDCFWIFLFPQTITSLRHEWTHPAFEIDKNQSIEWLKTFARDVLNMTYEQLMEVLEKYLETKHSYCLGFDTPDEVWTQREELWKHFMKVTGIKVSEDEQDIPFRCAC